LAKGVWFNKSTIIELAKTSFRGFKTTALAQRDEENGVNLGRISETQNLEIEGNWYVPPLITLLVFFADN